MDNGDDHGGTTSMRAKGSERVVQTKDVEAFTSLLQLPEMPLHVLDAMTKVTVPTVNGDVYGLLDM